jgi:hypothetical protein
VIRPIETFGAIAMQADSWHPDAAGYDLIARAVVAALRTDSRFMAFIGDTVTATPDAGTVDGR